MSVDRGQKKLARQMAAMVGRAKRSLYTVDASPGLNEYVVLLMMLHFRLDMLVIFQSFTMTYIAE